jgi:hypothetical protein
MAMETATRFADRHTGPTPVATIPGPEVARTLSVTASYLLSEEGRKASLLAGGDGRELQQISLQVPASRLHLVSVDKQGVARLKLRPRFETESDERIIRIDTAPVYDVPPSIEDLYRAAARNHELERAFHAQRTTAQTKRRETEHELRERVARTFMGDKALRALNHPAPSPKQCYIVAEHRRLLFDVSTDQGLAQGVPQEAHRRFRDDLRAREERNRQQRSAQLALHEEKKRFIADWIAKHGSDEQKARQAAGMLPMSEAIEAITEDTFAILRDCPRYTYDGVERLQAHVRQYTGDAGQILSPADLVVTSTNAVKATAEQWAAGQSLQVALPDANVVLREHRLSSKRLPLVPALVIFGVLVSTRVGPFVVRREYAAVH